MEWHGMAWNGMLLSPLRCLLGFFDSASRDEPNGRFGNDELHEYNRDDHVDDAQPRDQSPVQVGALEVGEDHAEGREGRPEGDHGSSKFRPGDFRDVNDRR